MLKDKEIAFLGSYAANTEIVPEIIDRLKIDLSKMKYSKEEIFEIVISMDETISNAIQATIENTKNLPELLYIIIRYAVSETEFDATIIDHGTGFDFSQTLTMIPDSKSDNYHDQVMSYTISTEKLQSSIKINGREISLRGIGAGLKIILNFMDSVSIEYMDKKEIIASSVSESTDGTILNIKRKRRIFN